VLAMMDRAIVERGWRSIVVAAEGSRAAGQVVAAFPGGFDPPESYAEIDARIRDACRRADVIHIHGVGSERYFLHHQSPVIVTLHAPATFYPDSSLFAPHFRFVAVSRYQSTTLPVIESLRIIDNGIDLQRYRPRLGRRTNLVFIGRICREKGPQIALRVAHRLGLPLVIAGAIPPFPGAVEFFQQEILPGLDDQRRYVGAIGVDEAVQLLSTARCVLMPASWAETSSLVAMEAIGCGVPVVAFPAGALSEIVEHGVTGFLVSSEDAMAHAVPFTSHLSPYACRLQAERRFDSRRMVAQYLAGYESVRAARW